MSTYNGWSNYGTWNVNLWLDNNGTDLSEMARECMEQMISNDQDKDSAIDSMVEQIKELITENTPTVTGVYADLLNAALSEVDWREIAAHHISDVTIYCAGWNMPGYMPDSEPALFLDAGDALEYIRDSAKACAEQDAQGEDYEEGNIDDDTQEIDAWKADSNGEFGQTFGNYHYFVSIV